MSEVSLDSGTGVERSPGGGEAEEDRFRCCDSNPSILILKIFVTKIFLIIVAAAGYPGDATFRVLRSSVIFRLTINPSHNR